MTEIRRLALIGFGEVGQILAADLTEVGCTLAAFDRAFADATSGPARAVREQPARQAATADHATADADAELIISAVTAAETAAAARSVADGLVSGAWFLDLNSDSPGQKREAADIVTGAGRRHVEAVVMSPISPRRLAAPILTGGPDAQAFLPYPRTLGSSGIRVVPNEVGPASATKMCRSVKIKGIEALLGESLLTARHHNVEHAVLASLSDLFPHADWPQLARYMISRTLEHGVRRGEEMREAEATVRKAGLEPWMSEACARRQTWSVRFAAAGSAKRLDDLLDQIRAAPAFGTLAEDLSR